ncbi:hypothetical protein PAPHI01_2568 [Pancytospora philotis]|nr:hypothetical protein PAPHI01_2568 [Pancytospora philotis]
MRQRTTENPGSRAAWSDMADIADAIDKFMRPSALEEQEDLELTRTICLALKRSKLDDGLSIRLINGLTLHMADPRTAFHEHARFVAAVLFRSGDFGIESLGCYAELADTLPESMREPPRAAKALSVFESNRLVANPQSTRPARRFPLYIQQAVKILSARKPVDAMADVCGRMEEMLEHTSDWALKNHGGALYTQLLDLSTPDLYDEQFRALACLVKRDFSLLPGLVSALFATNVETLQFYIIYTLTFLHDTLPDEMKVRMHVLFTEAFVESDAEFTPAVLRQIDEFVTKGMLLLSGCRG